MLAVRVNANVALLATVSINRSLSEGNTEPRATMVMPKNIMPKHAAINDFLIDLSSIIFTYLLIRY